MIRIAIVDDENIICSQMEQYLIKIEEELNICFDIDVLYSGKELFQQIKQNIYYDVVFLDIEMKEINGIEVSDYIRNQLLDDNMQIVYISGKTQYALELFKYSPLDFLVKPIEYNRLKQVVIKISRLMGLWSDIFSYKKNHEIIKVKIKDILFFESNGRKVKIYTTSNTDEFYAGMEDLYSQLKRFDFISIHRCYYVNYSHVKIFKYEYVEMTNGAVLPIGRSKRKEVQEKQLKIESRDIYED